MFVQYNSNGSYNTTNMLPVGDGTVPVISADIGGQIPPGQAFYADENHEALATNKDVINFVTTKFQNWISTSYNQDKILNALPTDFPQDRIEVTIGTIDNQLGTEGMLAPMAQSGDNYTYPSVKIYAPDSSLIAELDTDGTTTGEVNQFGSFSVSEDNKTITILLDAPDSGSYRIEVSGTNTYQVSTREVAYIPTTSSSLTLDDMLLGQVETQDVNRAEPADITLSASGKLEATIGGGGAYQLSIDENGDGSVISPVPVTVIQGNTLADKTPPSISFTETDVVNGSAGNGIELGLNVTDNLGISAVGLVVYDPGTQESLLNPTWLYNIATSNGQVQNAIL